jgi:hypothetical protein
MKKLASLAVLSVVFAGLSFAESVTGWVSDAKCHKAGAGHAGCAKKCVGAGGDVVIVTDDNKVYKVHNADAVKDMVGQKVTADGKVDGDSIHVDSAKAAS